MTSQITITEQNAVLPQQHNTVSFQPDRNNSLQQVLPPPQQQQIMPQQMMHQQIPQQNHQPIHQQQQSQHQQQPMNRMQVPGAGNIAQRSPSMRNYAQKPVMVVDGAYGLLLL